jgi:DNA-binding NarL/FixJ family response regulator
MQDETKRMKPKSIRLAILHVHPWVIHELLLLLQDDPRFAVVLIANTPGQLLCQLSSNAADIVLADDTLLYMNEYELTNRFKELFPFLKIIALLAQKQNDIINRMVKERKIAAALLRNCDQASLIKCIEKVAGTTRYLFHLTEREMEIIRLIEQEYNNKEIAQALFISERTVETHRKNIFRQTKTNSVIGLIKYAYEHKLV